MYKFVLMCQKQLACINIESLKQHTMGENQHSVYCMSQNLNLTSETVQFNHISVW